MTTAAPPEIEVEHLSRRFGGVLAVDDVSFAIAKGTITGLIGPNGAGKTTLLNLITGFVVPTGGRVRIAGQDLTGKRPHVLAGAGVARTYQNLLLLEDETVTENVRIGRHLVDGRHSTRRWARRGPGGGTTASRTRPDETSPGEDAGRRPAQVVADLVAELGLEAVADAPVASLPYGLRRRVEIARALATEPAVLILDEPTAGMTRDESDDIAGVVRQLRDRGCTVLLVEHNIRLVTAICDDVLVLDFGRLIGRESAAKVWDLDAVRVAYLGQQSDDTEVNDSAHSD